MNIYGIVLAGGLSRRMNGPDKAFLDLGGRPLLAHVLDRLRPQCEGIVLSRNGDPSRFDAYEVPVVADDIPDFAGPLAGILATLDWIAAHHPQTRSAAVSAVDTPFLPLDFVSRLRETARIAGTPAACAVSGGRRHPVTALWPVSARHDLRIALRERRERRVSAVLDRIGCAEAHWPSEPLDPFMNINTPVDIEAARRLSEGSLSY